MAESTGETTKPTRPRPDTDAYLVRHGVMRLIGEFRAGNGMMLRREDRVILRTDRGLEHGTVLCPSSPELLDSLPEPTGGTILRLVSVDDRRRIEEMNDAQQDFFFRAEGLIASHHLPMQLVDVEQLFGGERTVFYFMAENRVDFRELVKSMAREFQCRIELRQIGARDEAKLLADYGDCGKPVCCNTHMTVMPPVNMRMAKLQKATLDPNKISGRCGRLKCCLRFESDVYEEIAESLPDVGSRVRTERGEGTVIAQEILARRLLVEFERGLRLPVTLDEIIERIDPEPDSTVRHHR